jgi:histidinol-phosphate/aromatic aminotransferase/cobyric acid decarboxylase-like protein/SAM-dependent methyltransferase
MSTPVSSDRVVVSGWYASFFSDAYWSFADVEYAADRTQREVDYLTQRLHAAGAERVADLGCGRGRHAIALAKRGFEVVGYDIAEETIGVAAQRAHEASTDVQFVVVDLLSFDPFGEASYDAVISIQATGWGSDEQQLSLLSAIRRALRPGGLLILDHSSILAITRHFEPHFQYDLEGVGRYSLDRYFDPVLGRMEGALSLLDTAGYLHRFSHDVRMYSTPEILALVGAAGFDVVAVDGDFVAGGNVDQDTRYVQVVARAVAGPPASLGVADAVLASGALDLRGSPDEVVFIDVPPHTVWSALERADGMAEWARHYPVADPYGAERAAPALSSQFGVDLDPKQIVFGAGVTGLLHSASRLVHVGTLLTPSVAHPDLAAWVSASGGRVARAAHDGSVESWLDSIAANEPAVIQVDRPTLAATIMPKEDVAVLARLAEAHGGLVVVDETFGSYLPSCESLVTLTVDIPNLVVLRSVSKAYCSGGYRVAYAVAGLSAARLLREVAPPLQVSELPYQAALDMARAGDAATDRLRTRVAAVKPVVEAAFAGAGFVALSGDRRLPWALMHDPDGAHERALQARGVTAKRLPPARGPGDERRDYVRLSIPLDEFRVTVLLEALDLS